MMRCEVDHRTPGVYAVIWILAIMAIVECEILINQVVLAADLSTEIPVVRHHGIERAAISSDGKLCVTAGNESIRIWTIEPLLLRSEMVAHVVNNQMGPGSRVGVTGIFFANGDAMLVTSGRDGNIVFWDMASGKKTGVISENLVICNQSPGTQRHWSSWFRLPIAAVAVSPDGKTVARLSHGNIRLWDCATRKVIGNFGEEFETEKIDIDDLVPTDARARATEWKEQFVRNRLHFLDEDSTIPTTHLFRVKSKNSIGGDGCLAFSPDGQLLAASIGGHTYVWEWKTKTLRHTFASASHFSFSIDGLTIGTCDPYAKVAVWDVAAGHIINSIPIAARRIAFLPDDKSLLAITGDEIRRVDIATGRTIESKTAISSGTFADQSIVDPTGSLFGGIWAKHTSVLRIWKITGQ